MGMGMGMGMGMAGLSLSWPAGIKTRPSKAEQESGGGGEPGAKLGAGG